MQNSHQKKKKKWPEYSLGEWGGGLKERVNVSESQREEGQASSHSLAALGYSCRVTGRSAWEGAPGSGAAPLGSLLRQLLREAPCVQAPLPRLPLLPGLSSLKLLRMFLPSLGKALSCSARFAFLSLSGSTRTLESLFLCPLSWKARWQPSLGCFASTLDACARLAVLFRVYCRSYYARCCLLGGRGFHSGLSVLPRVYN